MNCLLYMSDEFEGPVAIMGILLPIIISLGAFLMIFGFEYLRNRERMALIERGMDPNPTLKRKGPSIHTVLRTSLLLLGVGAGLGIAYLIDISRAIKGDTDPLYFSMLFIFGGLGLLISFFVERRAEGKVFRTDAK